MLRQLRKSYQKHYYQMLKLAKKAYYHDYYIKNKSYIRSYQYAKYHNSKAGVEIVKENFKISTVPFPIFCAILNNIGAFVV